MPTRPAQSPWQQQNLAVINALNYLIAYLSRRTPANQPARAYEGHTLVDVVIDWRMQVDEHRMEPAEIPTLLAGAATQFQAYPRIAERLRMTYADVRRVLTSRAVKV